MWGLLKKNQKYCNDLQEWLEDSSNATQGAATFADVAEVMPLSLRQHALSCKSCEAAVGDFLASRRLLRALPSAAPPSPWFASRVMANIAAREAELLRSFDTWVVVPKLAARLTWISAVVLLLASTWLYERPAPPQTNLSGTDVAGESFVQNPAPASYDDILASLGDRGEVR